MPEVGAHCRVARPGWLPSLLPRLHSLPGLLGASGWGWVGTLRRTWQMPVGAAPHPLTGREGRQLPSAAQALFWKVVW